MGQFATGHLFAQMSIIRDIVYGAAMRGGRLKDICENVGLNVSDLNDASRRVPIEQAIRVWEVCVKATGDKQLGLHLGSQTGPLILGLVGHLMQSSRTLKQAFDQVVKFNETFTNLFTYRMEDKKATTTLEFDPASIWKSLSPVTAQHAVDQAMAGTLSVFRMLATDKVMPTRIEMEMPRPRVWREYEEVFQLAVQFGSTGNRLVFDSHHLSAAVRSYDESLFASLTESLTKAKATAKSIKLTHKIHNLILTDYMGQTPTIEMIAANFSMAPRSLQRKLTAENTTFREVVAATQMEVAKRLLSHQHKVSEVARLLGYSDARAFRRAFKSWTGNTPSKNLK